MNAPASEAPKTVVVKISGASLRGDSHGSSYDIPFLHRIAVQLGKLLERDPALRFILVLGGGNLLRGSEIFADFEMIDGSIPKPRSARISSRLDFAGMFGTVANALVFSAVLERIGLQHQILSKLPLENYSEAYSRRAASEALAARRIVIVAGGVGEPNFTTDSVAFYLAEQHGANRVLFGKHRVNGIFNADPSTTSAPEFISEISFADLARRKLNIFGSKATQIAAKIENSIEVQVFDIAPPSSLLDAFFYRGRFTTIRNGAKKERDPR
nr:uridylate kinase-like [Lytechinus pictus]